MPLTRSRSLANLLAFLKRGGTGGSVADDGLTRLSQRRNQPSDDFAQDGFAYIHTNLSLASLETLSSTCTAKSGGSVNSQRTIRASGQDDLLRLGDAGLATPTPDEMYSDESINDCSLSSGSDIPPNPDPPTKDRIRHISRDQQTSVPSPQKYILGALPFEQHNSLNIGSEHEAKVDRRSRIQALEIQIAMRKRRLRFELEDLERKRVEVIRLEGRLNLARVITPTPNESTSRDPLDLDQVDETMQIVNGCGMLLQERKGVDHYVSDDDDTEDWDDTIEELPPAPSTPRMTRGHSALATAARGRGIQLDQSRSSFHKITGQHEVNDLSVVESEGDIEHLYAEA